jgi:NAD(P)-dependent dehydrogenase (short-subunit alcohol dehydrogenase family)
LCGATTVYATARRPELIDTPGVTPLHLDITDAASIEAAAFQVGELDILVNNAGISTHSPLLGDNLDNVRREFDTYFWGTLNVTRAFAPRLAGGAILNVISALSWYVYGPASNGYAAAKAAEWSLTNGVRIELADQKTQVTALALALAIADTDMMAAYDLPKLPPAEVVAIALDGLEAGKLEVIGDPVTANVKAALAADPATFYADIPAAILGQAPQK